VYTRLGTLRDETAFRPWVAQLTRRVCLDLIAASGRAQSSGDALPPDASVSMDDLDDAFSVREALAGLSAQCQEMLDRFFARDQSYRTISADLDLPAGTIASRISRCLRRLRAELEGKK
jgi:RNA polymerase sigma factor (sigma-70 family)